MMALMKFTYFWILSFIEHVKLLLLFFLIILLGLEVGGEMNLAAGIQVAQLALKHRQNKKQQQRIIVFAGRCITLY